VLGQAVPAAAGHYGAVTVSGSHSFEPAPHGYRPESITVDYAQGTAHWGAVTGTTGRQHYAKIGCNTGPGTTIVENSSQVIDAGAPTNLSAGSYAFDGASASALRCNATRPILAQVRIYEAIWDTGLGAYGPTTVQAEWLADAVGCGATLFTTVNASYMDGELRAYWQHQGGDYSSAGMSFRLHSPVSSAALTTVLADSAAVPGYPGWFTAAVLMGAAPSPLTVKVADATTNTYCSIEGAVSLSAPAGPGDTGASDPDVPGESCGLNPFCYIKAALKWAFVPSQSTIDEITGFRTTLADKIPFSYVAQGVAVFTDSVDGCVGFDNCQRLDLRFTVSGTELVIFDGNGAPTPMTDLLTEYRPLLDVLMHLAVVGPLAIWAFKAYAPAKGGE
jgi:hypothetical protein